MSSAVAASRRCFLASLGDGLIIVKIFAVGCALYKDASWFRRWSVGRFAYTLILGGVMAVAVETGSLAAGRWQYDESMARVPVIELGLVPLLQIPILASLTFWATARWLKRRESRATHIRKHPC